MTDLSSVHDAMAHAQLDKPKADKLKTYTYRADPDIYEKASEICKNHGTTASEFARACMVKLVEDYSVGGQ